jgi:polysaccharide export outer membrane protein
MKAVFLIATLLMAGSAVAQITGPSENDRYRIGFQDRLTIQVFRHPELTQSIDVNTNGTINLFRLAEPVAAVCKTERELAEVNVTVSEQRSQAFAVLGAVMKPAFYMINRRVTLLELLAYAGGPSKEAGARLVVARTGSTTNCSQNTNSDGEDIAVMGFMLKDVLEAKQNPQMKPGDIVSVLEEDSVYVYGNVNKQGPVSFKEPITLMQAISSAEGLKPAAKKDKIRVFRQKQGSADREEAIYDLDKIAKRQSPDPFLEPNDVIAVSEDQAKSIFRSLGKSLTGGLPSLFYRVP